jgi:ParB family chromosome partitioning protein
MQVEERKLTEITPYERNPRRNDPAVDKVAESIKRYGFRQPIVIDKQGVIIAGHTRYKAAKQLKLKTVPVHVMDCTEEQAREYRLADNKTNEFAEWDMELLEVELEGLDMDWCGFELEDCNFEPGTLEEQGQLDELEPKIVKCPHCGEEFDTRKM